MGIRALGLPGKKHLLWEHEVYWDIQANGLCPRPAFTAMPNFFYMLGILIRETSLNLGAITAMIGEKLVTSVISAPFIGTD